MNITPKIPMEESINNLTMWNPKVHPRAPENDIRPHTPDIPLRLIVTQPWKCNEYMNATLARTRKRHNIDYQRLLHNTPYNRVPGYK